MAGKIMVACFVILLVLCLFAPGIVQGLTEVAVGL